MGTGEYTLERVVEDHVLRLVELPGGHRYEFEVDVLECGHVVSASKDIFGDTYPTRRRCYGCTGWERPWRIVEVA